MSCKLPNFTKLDALALPVNELEVANSEDDAVALIINAFSKMPNYSLSEETSLDPKNYKQSTDNIIEVVLDLVSNIENPYLDFTKGGKVSSYIEENLKQEYYPKGNIVREEEVDLSAVISGQLASREQIAAQRLSVALDSFFANNLPAKEYFKTHFQRELGLTAVVRIGDTLKNSSIVDDQRSLNENIEKFLAEKYFTVFKYLRSLGLSKGLPNSMFKDHKIVGTHHNTLDSFYNLLIHKSKIGTLEDEVEDGWANKISSKEDKDVSLFDAISAYLSIVYFDKLSKDAIGSYISMDKNLDYPITKDKDGILHYKYKFGKDTENRVHGWQIDVRDALKEMGNFSKFLISSIPIDDTYLTPVNYLGAFTSLFGKVSQLLGADEKSRELYQVMTTFEFDPINKMREMLELINSSKLIRSKLIDDKIVNPYELKVFDAVYDYVFKGNNSLFGIESAYNRQKGLTNRYPLVESLASQIASSAEMGYLQTIYDCNTAQYKTVLKKKYQTNKQFFDMVRAINNGSQTMEEVQLPYSFVEKSTGKYTIDLGNTLLEVKVIAEENPYGILTKRDKSKGIELVSINKANKSRTLVNDLIKGSDLSNKLKRQMLIDSRSDSALMDILGFVDFITGTSFTTTEDGLLEFELFKLNFEDSPFEAIVTAVRGLVVRDIHNGFTKAISEGRYNSSQIQEYIKKENAYLDTILGIDPSDSDWRTIWEPSIFGPDLTTVTQARGWVDDYVVIKQIMSGEISKANTKNLAGDSIPNYGLAFMGANFHQLINDKQHARSSVDGNEPLNFNLFMLNRDLVKGVVIDTDAKLANGTTKQIKNMTEGELFYHAFVNKFLIPLTLNTKNERSIYIQPTTYSDKTKFVNYQLSTQLNGKDMTKMSSDELLTLYVSSIGGAYNTILNNVLRDYAMIFGLSDYYMLAYPDNVPNREGILAMVREIDRRLATMTEYELVALARQKGVQSEILADTHFRVNGNRSFDRIVNGKPVKLKGLAFNESIVHYALNVYTRTGLNNRLKEERRKFLNQLFKNRFYIDGIYRNSTENLYVKALNDMGESPFRWIGGDGVLILAKVNGEDIKSRDALPEGADIELNPLLEKFFMIHSLLGNNLRMVLTGSEINHKNKYLGKVSPSKIIAKAVNPDNSSTVLAFQNASVQLAVTVLATAKGLEPQQYFDSMSLIEAYELIDNIVDTTIKNKIKKAIDRTMYEVESAGQGAQLKRNVIIPATMRYYTQNSLRGIPSTMRLAIMDDIQAPVFNFTGDDGSVDSHDGAAYINPITSILENWSLQENEVGTVKKPIWHYYDKEHMTSSLVKFAAHTITNNMMQQSQGSRVNMLNIFKKMSNTPWALKGNILEYAAHKVSGEITINDLSGGNDIYYRGADGTHYKIVDFGYENGAYYTKEIRVNKQGLGSGVITKYHYFDGDSNHIISLNPQTDPNLHTMSSIYEAHQVFGGINSESLVESEDSKELQLSEASNYIVANLINNVTIAKDPTKKKRDLNLTDYDQPLKTLMIDYICNNSAIKNGAGNRNSSDRFYNNEALDTITLGTEYYGIQMDADHEADEAEMTEFSQVISALDAGGRLHNYVSGIYQALGQIALEEAQIEMEAIEAYQLNPTEETRDALYDIIGKTIINNISTSRGQAGLADTIINQIKKRFNLTNAHKFDTLKIPFSDDNIYSNILSTFASIITNKSIRKKYPGLGAVLSPGYNVMMIYDIDGKPYQYKDLIKVATSDYKDYRKNKKDEDIPDDIYYAELAQADKYALENGFETSVDIWNKKVVDAYLRKKTDLYNSLKWKYKVQDLPNELPNWDLHLEEFMPTDNVGVQYQVGNDEAEWMDIALDKIDDYYLFKADPRAYVQDKLGKPVKILSFRKNIHKSRNLAPTKIWWEYQGKTRVLQGDGTVKEVSMDRTTNIFDSIHLIKNFEKSLQKKLKKESNESRRAEIEKQISRVQAYINRLIAQGVPEYADTQQLLDTLDAQSNNREIKLYNTPAELIMSNIYQTRFGLGVEESMVDVMKEGPKKAKVYRQVHQSVTPDFYDFVMTKDNGRNTYISLDRTFVSDIPDEDGNLPDVSYRWTHWKDTHRKAIGQNGIVNDVYTTTKDHRVLFKIGRDIVRDGSLKGLPELAYDYNGDYYYNVATGEKVENNNKLSYVDGKVVEFVEFVTRHEVNDKGRKHTVYNINVDKLKSTIKPQPKTLQNGHVETEEEALDRQANQYIQDLLQEIYEADSYEVFTVNDKQVKRTNLKRVQNILKGFVTVDENDRRSLPFEYDANLTEYLGAITKQFLKIPETKEIKRADLQYDPETDVIKFKDPKSVEIDENKQPIAKILRDRTINHKRKLNYKKYYSFLRSQYYTASRIPAQTLLSFMNMRQVGYTAEGSNLAYVSHWLTWLQGSDYDIDKAYIMGLAFDDNGQYIGWSSLFDFHNLDTIKASEYLPLPHNGRIVEESENGVDISEETAIITEADNALKSGLDAEEIGKIKTLRILAYVKIFEKLGDGKLVKGSSEEVLKQINHHNATKLPTNTRAQALRNFISIHIQNTILHVRNAADSYVPVDMNDLRDAAEDSPKGAEALEITLVNPLSVYTMQYLNMTGKSVIAISATGQKAAFMCSFYTNEVIKNAKLWDSYVVEDEDKLKALEQELLNTGQLAEGLKVYVLNSDQPVRQYSLGQWIPTNERYDYYIKDGLINALPNSKLKYSLLNFKTSRIAGRSAKDEKGKPTPNMHEVTSRTLPSVNFEGVDPILASFLEANRLNPRVPIDIIISQMISAATDNAKELILAKINAGMKLAKCYLFLMTLGYDINDIVKFMTCDAVSWIDSLSDSNIFLNLNLRLDEAITEIEKYLKNYAVNKDIDHYEDEFGGEVKDSNKKLKLLKNIIPSNLTQQQVDEALLDIQEFKNIQTGADEFSSFGRLLSINQGLPGKAEDLMGVLKNIRNLVIKREKDLGLINKDGNINLEAIDANIENADRYSDIYGGRFNPIRWLLDKEYQKRVSEYYDQIKVSFNIMAMASSLPHFNSMFKLLGGECTVNDFSVKSRILNACLEKINKECPNLYIDDKYYSRILGFASLLTMQQFITEGGFRIPIKNGTIINSNRTVTSVRSGMISLDTEEGIASFKYYFENVIIPELKAGTIQQLVKVDGSDITDGDKQEIRYNPFIMALARGNDGDVPIWKTNVNISADSAYTRIQLAKFNKGLKLLSNYKLGDLSISDWFALYNLVVNKNRYGSDRLTKVFENFINEYDRNGDSLINRYLKYTGDLDYIERAIDKLMNFTAMDLFIAQAKVVTNLEGQTDPVVIMYEDKVPVYYKRVGYDYVAMDNVLPPVAGESIEQKLHRFYLQQAYFVLGKPYSSVIERTKEMLDSSPINAITELMKLNKVELNIECV